MADEVQMTPRLSEGLRLALKDCANFTTYWWKPKAMEKLSAIGLVQRLPQEDRAGGAATCLPNHSSWKEGSC